MFICCWENWSFAFVLWSHNDFFGTCWYWSILLFLREGYAASFFTNLVNGSVKVGKSSVGAVISGRLWLSYAFMYCAFHRGLGGKALKNLYNGSINHYSDFLRYLVKISLNPLLVLHRWKGTQPRPPLRPGYSGSTRTLPPPNGLMSGTEWGKYSSSDVIPIRVYRWGYRTSLRLPLSASQPLFSIV